MDTVGHVLFGMLLRRFRLAAVILQATLAGRSGVSERAANNLERDLKRLLGRERHWVTDGRMSYDAYLSNAWTVVKCTCHLEPKVVMLSPEHSLNETTTVCACESL